MLDPFNDGFNMQVAGIGAGVGKRGAWLCAAVIAACSKTIASAKTLECLSRFRSGLVNLKLASGTEL